MIEDNSPMRINKPRRWRQRYDKQPDASILFSNTVFITMEEAEPEKIYTCHNGVIGIDTNPDGLALTEVAADGNFKGSIWIGNGELTTVRSEKRSNIIGEVVREAMEQAKKLGNGIAMEDLKFTDDKDVESVGADDSVCPYNAKSKRVDRVVHPYLLSSG